METEYEIVWSGPALTALEEVLSRIALFSPRAAERFKLGLLRHVGRLADQPYLGAVYRRSKKGIIRQIVYKKRRILYQVREQAERVEILLIHHGARDEPELLE